LGFWQLLVNEHGRFSRTGSVGNPGSIECGSIKTETELGETIADGWIEAAVARQSSRFRFPSLASTVWYPKIVLKRECLYSDTGVVLLLIAINTFLRGEEGYPWNRMGAKIGC
jgi:hypothetical protein